MQSILRIGAVCSLNPFKQITFIIHDFKFFKKAKIFFFKGFLFMMFFLRKLYITLSLCHALSVLIILLERCTSS